MKADDGRSDLVVVTDTPWAYGRNPDPDKASDESVWELAIGNSSGRPSEIGRLIDMLSLLWEGQSRHGGSPNARVQTSTEGEAAVHLAATLVQWLTSGVLRRKA